MSNGHVAGCRCESCDQRRMDAGFSGAGIGLDASSNVDPALTPEFERLIYLWEHDNDDTCRCADCEQRPETD